MTEIFIGSEAVAAGRVSRHELKRWYRPVFRGVYAPNGVELSIRDRAIAAWLASRRRGVIAGVAASALHGAPWVDPSQPIELVDVRIRAQPGLIPRGDFITDDEITTIGGLPVTSRVRTAFDMGRRLHRTEALARLDALMWNQRYDVDQVAQLGRRHPHATGLARLYELLPLVDGGAASIPESRVRLWLHDAGLPRPETQIPVIVGYRPEAWLDMGWREYKVAVEYDGDHHRKNRRQYVKDIGRLRMLESLGWIVVRVIAEDKPRDVIARAEAALVSRGCNLDIDKLQSFKRNLVA
ncbi:DUF559 domain-containing protein [Mycobacterium sp. E740]|uniref:DUF559 domain-containing protein n=1 Tax=Mycobacterium sp. E740 TaxID=1834149 RepID=UPI0007FE3898|nr:DUF559 domain-containing protein [Mycobacterium sp. E740]OBI83004.1 hypothetical protein A5663_13640 [Mycobacterium sp. E740]